MASVRPWLPAALFLGFVVPLASCTSSAGSQIAGKLIEGALSAAAGGSSRSSGGAAGSQCPASCEKGTACDKVEGRCVTEQMAAALARARKESAERPAFEVPPDPCSGRCPPDQRCELRSGAAECLPEPPPDP